MDTYAFHNKDGHPTYHLLYQVQKDDLGKRCGRLVSTLPDELIKSAAPKMFRLLKRGSRHLDKNAVEIFKELGKRINLYPPSSYFFYPEHLLVKNNISRYVFNSLIDLEDDFTPLVDEVYSSTANPIEYTLLNLKLQRIRLFYSKQFKNNVTQIEKIDFEKQLNDAAAECYIDHVSGTGFSFHSTQYDGDKTAYFILKDQQLLMFFTPDK